MFVKLYFLTTYLYVAAATDNGSLPGRILDELLHWRKFTPVINKVIVILKNPRHYPREAVTIISVVILSFSIMILFIAIIFSVKKQYEIQRVSRSIKRAIPKEELVRRAAITGIMLVVLLAVVNIGASQPFLCTRCHAIEQSHAEWQKSTHRDVGCLSCHYEPGIFGYVIGNITGAEHVLAHFFKGDGLSGSIVSNSSCLQCHGDIFSRIVESKNGVRIRHKDLITGGFTCTSCHPDVAHKTKTGKTFAMNSCTGCHNGKTASAKCSTCHKQDIAYKASRTLEDWPKVKTIAVTCTGCHTPKETQKCINCHGLSLPHSAEFIKHHPMEAEALNGLCYKCHWTKMVENRMCGCHDVGEIHGLPDKWYFEHRVVAKKPGAGCNCHGISFCARCHDDAQKVYPMNYAGGGGAYQMQGGWNTGMGNP